MNHVKLQGDESEVKCPYLFRTHWEYADVEQPGWQWVYDYTGKLVCPNDPCSMTKCGFHATCNIDNAQAVCSCELGYEGNPYSRCYPKPPENCDCLTLEMTRFLISYPVLINFWLLFQINIF